ncbi:hypothetical protein L1987_62830 [Smallanthus sonchifolius]|uniref:Uncharacterized protein n=1 Tax=Smallanthus sonchifolius TaxID=185202 RepID=A0ACB9CBG3_9ASTR|nr:hypothetical protein L1987_62830 [Smallanthus sonchifolius]
MWYTQPFIRTRYIKTLHSHSIILLPRTSKEPYRMEGLPLDIISNLPSSIIQTILTFMPIRDAFRTSVLSRNWRYHCANITKLDFNDEMRRRSGKYKLSLDIYKVLLLHHGPVLEFSLCMFELDSCFEIDKIILYLSRNTALEKLTLCIGLDGHYHKLPSSFFSFQNLTHLKLFNCAIHPLASFSGFGRLTSLCFYDVVITKSTLLWFLRCCPKIKNFTLIGDELCFIESGCSDFIDLFQCLPLIEHLEMNSYLIKFFALGAIPQKFTNAIVHLNFLCLSKLSFKNEDVLCAVLLLVSRSPNIEKIKLEMCRYNTKEMVSQTKDFFDLLGYSCISLEHLRELEITRFLGMKPEMNFVKVILSKSPMLEKVRLVFGEQINFTDRLETQEGLLEFPRASSRAKVTFGR